jgi:hypothetical protein
MPGTPHSSVRAVLSAYGSYLGCLARQAIPRWPHTRQSLGHACTAFARGKYRAPPARLNARVAWPSQCPLTSKSHSVEALLKARRTSSVPAVLGQ